MWKPFTLGILFILTISLSECTNQSQDSFAEFDEIPSIDDWVRGLADSMDEDKERISRLVLGQMDTLHLVAQIVGATGPITEQQIADSLAFHLNRCAPDLIIVRGLKKTEASLLLQVDITVESQDIFYGFSNLSLRRDVEILRTGYHRSGEIWDDLLAFHERGDPLPRLWWLIQLHATKFSALWLLSNK